MNQQIISIISTLFVFAITACSSAPIDPVAIPMQWCGVALENKTRFDWAKEIIPSEWLASASQAPRYFWRLETQVRSLGSCAYSGNRYVSRDQVDTVATIFDSTGYVHVFETFEGETPAECPPIKTFYGRSPEGQVLGKPVDRLKVENWFRSWMKRIEASLFDRSLSAPPQSSSACQITEKPVGLYLGGDNQNARSLAFSSDGALVAVGSDDGFARVWQVADGVLLRTLGKPPENVGAQFLSWLSNTQPIVTLAFSTDKETLTAVTVNGSLYTWRIKDGALLRTRAGFADRPGFVAISNDGTLVALSLSGQDKGKIQILQSTDGVIRRTIQGNTRGINKLEFSPDGKFLAALNNPVFRDPGEDSIRVWCVSDGVVMPRLTGGAYQVQFGKQSKPEEFKFPIESESTQPMSFAFARDGATLAVAMRTSGPIQPGDYSVLGFYRYSDGSFVDGIWNSEIPVSAMSFSPDGRLIATASMYEINLWQNNKLSYLRTIKGHTGVWNLTFSPDGKLLASMGLDKKARLWFIDE